MIERRTTRRGFIVTGALSLGAIAFLGGKKLLGEGNDPEEPLTKHVGDALDDEGLRAIGKSYLRARPREDDERRLVRLVQKRGAWRRVSRPQDVIPLLRAESRRDYRMGRTVSVEGWLLSRTEARLCALAAYA